MTYEQRFTIAPLKKPPEVTLVRDRIWLSYIRNALGYIMPSCNPHTCKDEKGVFKLLGITLITYFLIMDIIMFVSLQKTPALPDTKPAVPGHYSVFSPLTTKHLMTDHVTLYIINPSVEYFESITNFSSVFSFITPNIISFFHLLVVAPISMKLVSSLNLTVRRIGACFFMFRSWLDTLDGVVYRSRKGMGRMYHSERSSSGYLVDAVCDGLGGVLFSFGILFYFFKIVDSKASELPYTKLATSENGTNHNNNNNSTNPVTSYSKCRLFWKMWCAGFLVGVAASAWDFSVENMKIVFSTKLTDPKLTALQTEYLHSITTWCVMWLWRLCEGQIFFVYMCWSIFVDKVWEYVNFVQYIGYLVVFTVFMINFFYIRHMKAALHIL
ncbi:hypothetical protein LOTGIDRAFT_237577 [Lottia gigantea]|uniref:Uncharacterized protein n=1 Tax=Lottia gigantea TaxID=225164 RepID=V4AHX8_LOTGI|nr:hypothetical protein LOTGIDRAFT_237577 [Lottia gigantea]ESP03674.1 hypothetical protein LOTGIDRAFT_237577 [Lottia gigantea]